MYRAEALVLCVLVFASPVATRKLNVGGSNRGGSAARGNVPGGFHGQQHSGGFQQGGQFHQNQQGSFHPAQPGGNFHQPQGGVHQPSGGFHQPSGGFNQGGGFRPNSGGFNSGTGLGSASRGSQWKTALAAGALGAVGGIVTYELGKAIINSATSPFHHNDRSYYFDDHNYQQRNGYTMCSMPLEQLVGQTKTDSSPAPVVTSDGNSTVVAAQQSGTPSPDQILANLQFKDGSRPKTISWGCRTGAEVCCGTDCCPAPPPPSAGAGGPAGAVGGMSIGGIIFGVLVVILLLLCCCCCLVYTFMRSSFNSLFSSNQPDPSNPEHNVAYSDGNKYSGGPNYDQYQQQQQQQQQAYPMQSYPSSQPQQYGGGYPPSQGYTYPSQPPPFQQQYAAYPPQNY